MYVWQTRHVDMDWHVNNLASCYYSKSTIFAMTPRHTSKCLPCQNDIQHENLDVHRQPSHQHVHYRKWWNEFKCVMELNMYDWICHFEIYMIHSQIKGKFIGFLLLFPFIYIHGKWRDNDLLWPIGSGILMLHWSVSPHIFFPPSRFIISVHVADVRVRWYVVTRDQMWRIIWIGVELDNFIARHMYEVSHYILQGLCQVTILSYALLDFDY